ncbi:hypothetical protein HU200_011433 [Digitaria exilis]|uniref:Uncharacterized protein n=1 Tax=Digitaria exilis TaxID=1010633 RepID=A0A835KLC5_9POAL|nr:hypothetical protein HU200_011433 [Digitaria exilis]
MMQGLARQAEPLRTRTTLEIMEDIRSKHGVHLPLDSNLYGPVCNDFYAKYGQPKDVIKFGNVSIDLRVGLREDLIKYWRDNREKYDFSVTTQGKIKEAEARTERMREEMLRRDRFKFDPLKVYPPGSWEEERQEYVAYWEGIDLRTVRIKAKLAQMEAMRALVRDLPGNMDSAEGDKDMVRDDHLEMVRDLLSDLGKHVTKGKNKEPKQVRFAETCDIIEPKKGVDKDQGVDKGKGKGIVIISSDDDLDDGWGDDELLSGCYPD